MDLPKIIGELKAEKQRFDEAIAALERHTYGCRAQENCVSPKAKPASLLARLQSAGETESFWQPSRRIAD